MGAQAMVVVVVQGLAITAVVVVMAAVVAQHQQHPASMVAQVYLAQAALGQRQQTGSPRPGMVELAKTL